MFLFPKKEVTFWSTRGLDSTYKFGEATIQPLAMPLPSVVVWPGNLTIWHLTLALQMNFKDKTCEWVRDCACPLVSLALQLLEKRTGLSSDNSWLPPMVFVSLSPGGGWLCSTWESVLARMTELVRSCIVAYPFLYSCATEGAFFGFLHYPQS